MKEDDVDARDEALKSALLVKEADEDESTGWKTWQYVALWVPVGVVVLAAAIVVPIVIVRKREDKKPKKTAFAVFFHAKKFPRINFRKTEKILKKQFTNSFFIAKIQRS